MTRERRTYTTEFKAEAVRMLADQGLSLVEVARKLGIHWSAPQKLIHVL